MPREVHCPNNDTSGCFLETPEGANAKFCQECGASAASVGTFSKMPCVQCGFELEDSARFCSECGTKVERDRVSELLANHVPPSQRGGTHPKGARGLTAEEQARMEAAIRAPSKVTDPVKTYEVDPEHKQIMGLHVPDADDKAVGLARGRIATRAAEGKHSPGALSNDTKLPSNYHEGVQVIPYRFKNPAKRGPEVVQDPNSKGSSSKNLSASDVDAFFRDEPEANLPPVTVSKTASTEKKGLDPSKVDKCRECGRPMAPTVGECFHCVDPERLESLWKTQD